MTFKKTIHIFGALLLAGLSGALMISCKSHSMNGMIILTQTQGDLKGMNFVTGDAWRYLPETRLVALNPEKPAEPVKVLTADFYSACSPEISWSGKTMLFAAQKKKGEPWQIWEMDLAKSTSRQVVSQSENCIDPAYLPGDRIVFTKAPKKDTIGAAQALFTCKSDGSELKQITYHPSADFASSVISDGRILSISRQVLPARAPMLFVVRPDGTKGDLYYAGTKGTELLSKPYEANDGMVYFIESGATDPGNGSIVCIHQNRPLHSKTDITKGITGDFRSVFPMQSGKLLISCRTGGSDRYALYELDAKKASLGQPIYSDAKYNTVQAVAVEVHNRPKKLPSEVDPEVKTGLLMCQNINFLDLPTMAAGGPQKKVRKIEILGINASLGVVDVEEDGSFYLKALANMPIRIRALDEDGKAINGTCTWLWLRPNERRGCVGCHEDHEMAPENRVALAVKKAPVIIPIHITKINEKEVEVE